MKLSFDKFERYELPQVTLCNPNSRATEVNGKITITDTVGVLSNPKGMNLKLNFNAPHELSFDYYRHKDADPARVPIEYIVEVLDRNNKVVKQIDTFPSHEEAERCVDEFDLSTLKDGEYLNIIKQSFYDKIYEAIQTDRYVYLTDIGYFVISSVTDSDEDNIDKKSISLKSCEENELAVAEGLYLEEGTYYLHTDNNDGLLDLFLPKTAGWTISFIDPSLLEKPYYVEKTEVDNGYNFLYTTVQDMFECIVEPDIIKRTISVYSRVYYAEHHLTDIHIAKYNLLKYKTAEENDEDKYTALNVQGKDENLEIRAVNPTGKNVIYNFEPRYAWMSPALQQAIEKWQEKCESVENEYLALQKNYYNELEKLFDEEQDIEVLKEGLKKLEATKDAAWTMVAGDEKAQSLINVKNAITAKQNAINKATSDYNTHKTNVQTTYEEPINKINADCTLGMSIENFVMEIGTINSADGQLSNNKKRIRTANYTILDAGIYTVSNTQNFPVVLYVYDSNNNYLSDLSVTNWSNSPFTFTLDSQYKIKFAIKKSDIDEISISDVSGIEIKKMTGSFAVDIDGNEIFTENLLNELMTHIKPTDYVDEYMLVTESMTYPQRFEKAKELMDRAKSQLVKISSGQKTYSVDTRSFLFNKHFKHFSEQLCAGAIIYVETKKDIMEQLHLTGIDINFDDKSTSFILGNKYDRSDLKALYDEALGKNSKSFNELKYVQSLIEDQQKDLTNQKKLVNQILNLTLDNVITSDNQSIEINSYGLLGRRNILNEDGTFKKDDNGNLLFDPEQIRLVNNTIVFTEDNWQTASTAIGKIIVGTESDNVTPIYSYGVVGQTIIGELILGNNLVLTGTGAGIKIKDNNNKAVFYADEDGNLVLSGTIFANKGKLGGWDVTPTNIQKKIKDSNGIFKFRSGMYAGDDIDENNVAFYAGCSVEGQTNLSENSNFSVTHGGKLTAKNVNISGGSLNINNNFKVSSNGNLTANDVTLSGIIKMYGVGTSIYNASADISVFCGETSDENTTIAYGRYDKRTGNKTIIYGNTEVKVNSRHSFLVAVHDGIEIIKANDKGANDTVERNLYIGRNGDWITDTENQKTEQYAFKVTNIRGTDVRLYTHNSGAVYLGSSGTTAVTSDENLKDLYPIDERYEKFFMNLKPVLYKYKVGHRIHLGYGARAVENALTDAGLTTEEFAGILIAKDVTIGEDEVISPDGQTHFEELYSLRYEEFGALYAHMLKKSITRINYLENTVTELKTQLQTLTAG